MEHEETIKTFAARTLWEIHGQMLSHEAGARAGEVEGVHDMRVSIRRLRVALSNFAACLTREDRRRVKLRLEHLATALGGVRDLDVMIEAMSDRLAARPEAERPAIESFLKRLRTRRHGRLRTLARYLQSEEYAALKLEFPAPKEKPVPHGKAA